MTLSAGTRLGPYEVVAPIGAGGMGEVYRAHDTQLKRDVALKVLPATLATDADRLARFQREAELLAALNHPNIAHIYGFEYSQPAGSGLDSARPGKDPALHSDGAPGLQPRGIPALVMELVEGPTLAERIARGAIPVADALPIVQQLAQALEYAHERGIIHRDLKPANIKITPDGDVKVLDFGLAKALAPDLATAAGDLEAANSPTITTPAMTEAGIILGTAAYMSPEQARGAPVDKRTDIWAFGVVLYEMLTGRRAFAAASVTDTIAAVVLRDPDWSALPANTPAAIRKLLRRCLQRDARQRLHDIADARLELAEAAPAIPEGDSVSRPVSWLAKAAPAAWIGLGLIVGAVAALQLWPSRSAEDAVAPPPSRLSITLADAAAMSGGPEVLGSEQRLFDLSPDGTGLVYTGAWNDTTRLYYRPLNDFEATPIAGTEGGYHPFFSPTGEWVGFVVGDAVRKVRLSAGAPEPVTTAKQIQSAAWSDDGWIYILAEEGTLLVRVPADTGGQPTELYDFSARQSELPHLLDTAGKTVQALRAQQGLLLTLYGSGVSADTSQIAHYSVRDDRMTLLAAGYEGRYSATGHLVFVRGGALLAAPLDLVTLKVLDEPKPVLEGLRVNSSYGSADFDISEFGTLVYVAGGNHGITVPTWVDLLDPENEAPMELPPQQYGTFRLSDDGRRLVIVVAEARDALYVYDVARSGPQKLPVEGIAKGAVWSHDGNWIAYSAFSEGKYRIRRLRPDTWQDDVLYEGNEALFPDSFSRDGGLLTVSKSGGVFVLDLSGPSALTEFFDGPGFDWGSRLHPDGKWIAYTSNEAGTYNVYLREFPDTGHFKNVSITGGEEPVWAPDGRRLFYRWGADWYAVDITADRVLEPGPPKLLFRRPFQNVGGHSYDVGPHGRRLLVVKSILNRESVTDLRVVLNWGEELKAHVPNPRRP